MSFSRCRRHIETEVIRISPYLWAYSFPAHLDVHIIKNEILQHPLPRVNVLLNQSEIIRATYTMIDVRILANALGWIGDVPSTLPLSMHLEALSSFQPRENLCLGRGGESVLSGKHRDAYQSLCLARSTDTLPLYPITVQAFLGPESRNLYNIEAVISFIKN